MFSWLQSTALVSAFILASAASAAQPVEGGGNWSQSDGWKLHPSVEPSSPTPQIMAQGPSGVGVSLDVETVPQRYLDRAYVYSAKYLCGKIPHGLLDPQDPPIDFPLAPGTYRTAINVNNPNLGVVAFSKLALTTNRETQPAGRAGPKVDLKLGQDQGLEIDCQDIQALLATGSGSNLFDNTNFTTVFQDQRGPPNPTVVTLTDPGVISQIITYHWNNGAGDDPGPNGTIGLRDSSGVVRRFHAHGTSGQGNAPNVNWVADTNNTPFLAGTYRVVDSSPTTWSFNQPYLAGFAIVRGSYSFIDKAPFFKGFVVLRSDKPLDVVGVYTVKNILVSPPVVGRSSANVCQPPMNITVTFDDYNQTGGIYHQFHDMNLKVNVVGGTPPYSPVVFTLKAREFTTNPITMDTTFSNVNTFLERWSIVTPTYTGDIHDAFVEVMVTDANKCVGYGRTAIRVMILPN